MVALKNLWLIEIYPNNFDLPQDNRILEEKQSSGFRRIFTVAFFPILAPAGQISLPCGKITNIYLT